LLKDELSSKIINIYKNNEGFTMLDIKFIRENQELVQKALKDKNTDFDLDGFLALDKKRRGFLQKIETLRAEQNRINDEISNLLKEKKDASSQILQTKEISSRINSLEKDFKKIRDEFQDKIFCIPNVPHSSVPKGDISHNQIVRTWGEIKKKDFPVLNHSDLAERLDIVDFKRASKITGANFVLFKKQGALLERALINFMLDLHTTQHGFSEVFPPFLVNRQSMTGTGQLPKLEDDMYKVYAEDFFLIPTAEVPVTNLYSNEVLDEKELPIYHTAYTACFRREAGSYGKDTRGLIRVHQFDKVELVKFVKPQTSYEELESLVVAAEKVLQLLDIPYRVVSLATGDLSFAAAKCYDIEAYSCASDTWLEVSSCSNFEDFQARRANIRFLDKDDRKKKLVHTLNGSGLALARTVVAIMENYQNSDGSITIPEVLRKYMHGREYIGPEKK
jgi:seryl-tRNA synthetase